MKEPPEADNPALLQRIVPVSRETEEKLRLYVDLLKHWQKTQNLVSSFSLQHIWWRHIADSLQLLELGQKDAPWVDLGSGAGLPGLVLAICGQEQVHLVESNHGKCAFLTEVVRITRASAVIHCCRVEDSVDNVPKTQKTITARALAPLARLCELVEPLFHPGTVAVFPKGRNAEIELAEARRLWAFDYERIPSRTEEGATILRLTSLQRRKG
jgi:16S rRNA (guanine527-N7)-methyltransferase